MKSWGHTRPIVYRGSGSSCPVVAEEDAGEGEGEDVALVPGRVGSGGEPEEQIRQV
ncbi:MAG TPA: hypothetical protein VM118_05170 [Acidobacteriota bacterium]|nr:hypothetical protein [Acidobacteriota bacterium]